MGGSHRELSKLTVGFSDESDYRCCRPDHGCVNEMSLLRPVDSGAVRDVPFATDARPRRNAGKVPDVRTGMEERFRMTARSLRHPSKSRHESSIQSARLPFSFSRQVACESRMARPGESRHWEPDSLHRCDAEGSRREARISPLSTHREGGVPARSRHSSVATLWAASG